jgi:hypothetical protein
VGGGLEIIESSSCVIGGAAGADRDISYASLFDGSPFWSPGQTLIRTAVLREVGGLDTSIWGADDYDLWLRLGRHWKLRGYSKVALQYRQHPGNASRDWNRMTLNIRRVLMCHVRASPAIMRRALARRAHRQLYYIMGRRILGEFKRSVAARDSKLAFAKLKALLDFAVPAAQDPILFRQLFRDLLPTRLCDWINQVRGRPGRGNAVPV